MKKLLYIILSTFLFIGTFALTNSAQAQTEEGDFKIGGGLVFGSGVGFGSLDNDIGIRADGYYAFTPEIRGGGDFTFYFPKSEGPSEISVWELNFNGNYIFHDEEGLMAYGLAGINITGISWESTFNNPFGDSGTNSYSESEIGLNLGAGIEYALDFADLFAEAKISNLGGNADQFVLGAGLRFPL